MLQFCGSPVKVAISVENSNFSKKKDIFVKIDILKIEFLTKIQIEIFVKNTNFVPDDTNICKDLPGTY